MRCPRVTQRSQADSADAARWRLLDTVEEELTYVGGRESYRAVKFNGRPVKPNAHLTTGFKSAGEFGAVLAGIFATDTETQFVWEGTEASSGHRVEILRFNVALEHSGYRIGQGSKRVRVGFHGVLRVAADSGRVERLSFETDAPEGLLVGSIGTDVEFGEIPIGDRTYLLPGRAEAITRFKNKLYKRTMEFKNYHKYLADSVVTFDPPK